MSLVTITTTSDDPAFNESDHRAKAAELLGVKADAIHITGFGPDTEEITQQEEWSEPLMSQDGTVLKPSVLIKPTIKTFTRASTWDLKPAQRPATSDEQPERVVEWPAHVPTRGVKWHGAVTIDGKTGDHMFISDGNKLQLLDSPEGNAVVKALAGEADTHQAATGG